MLVSLSSCIHLIFFLFNHSSCACFQTAQPQTFTTFSARSLLTRSCAWPTLHVPVFIRHFKVQQDTFLPLQRTALFSALKATARTILSPRHFGCFSELFPKKKQKEHILQLWHSMGTHFPVRTPSETPGAPPQRFMLFLVTATEKWTIFCTQAAGPGLLPQPLSGPERSLRPSLVLSRVVRFFLVQIFRFFHLRALQTCFCESA